MCKLDSKISLFRQEVLKRYYYLISGYVRLLEKKYSLSIPSGVQAIAACFFIGKENDFIKKQVAPASPDISDNTVKTCLLLRNKKT